MKKVIFSTQVLKKNSRKKKEKSIGKKVKERKVRTTEDLREFTKFFKKEVKK